MFKVLWNLLKLGILLFILGVFFHHAGAKWLSSYYLQHRLGTRVSVEDMELDFVNSRAKLVNVKIHNPMAFPGGVLAEIPVVYMEMEPWSLIRGKLRFKTLDIHLNRIRVLRTDRGTNLYALKTLETVSSSQAMTSGNEAPRLWVDRLQVRFGAGTFTDSTGERLAQRSFQLNERRVLREVRGFDGLVHTLAQEILGRMGLEGQN